MTNSEQAIREFAEKIFADLFECGLDAQEIGMPSFDQLLQSGYIDRKITDLTALISEHYVSREEHEKMKHDLTHCHSCGTSLSRDCSRCKHLWET